LNQQTHPLAGRASMFVGRAAGGEIYNQAPTEFQLSGTRRWLPGTSVEEVQREYRAILAEVADARGVIVEGSFQLARDSFEIDRADPLVAAFQSAHHAATGRELPIGAKPFVDDGNSFIRRGGVPAITHGPDAKGAHTLQ